MNKALLFGLLIFSVSICQGQNLKKCYKKISKDDFEQFDSVKLVSKIGDISLYSVLKTSLNPKFNLRYLILEKNKGKKSRIYQLDISSELKNDSTIIFYAPALLMIGNKDKWEDGKWFYADFYKENRIGGIKFNIDSVPSNSADLIKNSQEKGIYKYNGIGLEKISDEQSEQVFYELKVDGLYYIPNPGRFYIEVKLSKIIN